MSEESQDLLYEPAPEVSEGFRADFDAIVPICPNGKDRYLRYIWGMDRVEFCAGNWERRYHDTEHDPPKYVGRDRWILEGWQSPDVYDRKGWARDKHLLGEFPVNGFWDFVEYHETADGQFLPLDNTALERAREWKWWKGIGKKRSIEHLMKQRLLRWSLQQQRRQERADKVSTRFGEEVVKLFEQEKMAVHSVPSKIGGFKESASGILVPV